MLSQLFFLLILLHEENKLINFASYYRKTLTYGVMVALQFLDLPV